MKSNSVFSKWGFPKIVVFLFGFIFFLIFGTGCHIDIDDLDYETNLVRAYDRSHTSGKPIFLYFSAFTLGYDEFGNDLVKSRVILNKLNKEFITVILHIDDDRKISESDTLGLHRIVSFSGINTRRLLQAKKIGTVNALLQRELFRSSTQPLYAILDPQGNSLIEPFNYMSKDKDYFLEQLNTGLANYQNVD